MATNGILRNFAPMKRLCYLDNLKVCLTVLVIMHHAGQAYGNGGGWAYTPSNPAEFMPWIWHFLSTNAAFFMGLFFLIAIVASILSFLITWLIRMIPGVRRVI